MKKIKLTQKELSRKDVADSGREYTVITRPQENGKILVAVVWVDTGEIEDSNLVDDRSEVSGAVKDLMRWMDKLSKGGQMSDSSRGRDKKSSGGISMDNHFISKELIKVARLLMAGKDFEPNHAVRSVLDKFGLKFVKTKMGDYSSMSAASTKYIFKSDREFSKDELWQIKKELEKVWEKWVKDEAKRLNSRNRHSVYVFWPGWDTSDTIEVQETIEYEIQFH